jgi:Uncharacterised protein family (UPF0158)
MAPLGRMESGMITVKYDDLSAAFDFVSFGTPFEHRAFVCRDTGAVYWISEMGPLEEEDLPDDLETSDRYIAVPHKNDLDLGSHLALRFANEQLPHRFAAIRAVFQQRGAYARFKELLSSEGCLDKWYAYEAEATEQALRAWCEANEIQLDRSGDH